MRGTQAILTTVVVLTAGISMLATSAVDAAPHKTILAAKSKSTSDQQDNPIVTMLTNKGTIKIKVFKKEAPITSANFLDLVRRHFYDRLTFHRYVKDFVIQGGDPDGTGSGNFVDPKTHKVRHIKLEKVPTLNHDAPGMVAMARTDNPNSASCQFYFTLKAATFLDNPPGYAVFGKVVDGMDTVMKLRRGDKIVKATAD